MKTTRRTVLAHGGKAILAAAALPLLPAINPAQAQQDARPDPLREGVQALVNEIRRDLGGHITMGEFWRLQEVADRLEGLPGIQPVANELWRRWKARTPPNFGMSIADVISTANRMAGRAA